jgi:pyrimidine deaminase RibD-like protein
MKTSYFNVVALLILAALTIGTGYSTKKALAHAEAAAARTQTLLAAFDLHLTAVETRIGEIHYRDTSALTECGAEIGRLKQRLDIIKNGVLTQSRHNRGSGR